MRQEGASSKPSLPTLYPIQETEQIRKRLSHLSDISRRAGSNRQVSQLVQQVTQTAQLALNACAASILLLDDDGHDLIFEVADGPAGNQLTQLRISATSGIAGWVAYHGEPAIVNDVTKDSRFNPSIDRITGFETKAVICAPLVARHKVVGVIEVLNRLDGTNFGQHDLQTLAAVAATAALTIDSARSHQGVLDSFKSTVRALAAAIDAKDPYACGHSQRVFEYVLLGLNSLPVSREDKEVIEYAAILHDIGKAYIPDKILLKPGPFTAEEWKVIRKHPVIGCNMLKQIPYLEKSSKLVLHHHERYDGNGYPAGLRGDATPIGARLIAVADAFDAMTTCHLYRVAGTVDSSIEKLRRLSGTQFCPTSIQAFAAGFSKFHFRPTD